MHVHPPKPLHGWREFLNEVLIVVIGILIALALENVVERLRERDQAKQSMEAIKAELQEDAVDAWERLAVNDCLNARLRDLSGKLLATDGAWKADPLPLHSWRQQVAPLVVSSPSRDLTSDAWKAAVASGAYARLGKARADALREAYEGVRTLAESQSAEGVTAVKLSPLGYDVRLTPDGKLQMLQLVGEADGANAFEVLMARQVLHSIAGLHLGFDARELATAKAATLRDQRARRGACVTDPPLQLN